MADEDIFPYDISGEVEEIFREMARGSSRSAGIGDDARGVISSEFRTREAQDNLLKREIRESLAGLFGKTKLKFIRGFHDTVAASDPEKIARFMADTGKVDDVAFYTMGIADDFVKKASPVVQATSKIAAGVDISDKEARVIWKELVKRVKDEDKLIELLYTKAKGSGLKSVLDTVPKYDQQTVAAAVNKVLSDAMASANKLASKVFGGLAYYKRHGLGGIPGTGAVIEEVAQVSSIKPTFETLLRIASREEDPAAKKQAIREVLESLKASPSLMTNAGKVARALSGMAVTVPPGNVEAKLDWALEGLEAAANKWKSGEIKMPQELLEKSFDSLVQLSDSGARLQKRIDNIVKKSQNLVPYSDAPIESTLIGYQGPVETPVKAAKAEDVVRAAADAGETTTVPQETVTQAAPAKKHAIARTEREIGRYVLAAPEQGQVRRAVGGTAPFLRSEERLRALVSRIPKEFVTTRSGFIVVEGPDIAIDEMPADEIGIGGRRNYVERMMRRAAAGYPSPGSEIVAPVNKVPEDTWKYMARQIEKTGTIKNTSPHLVEYLYNKYPHIIGSLGAEARKAREAWEAERARALAIAAELEKDAPDMAKLQTLLGQEGQGTRSPTSTPPPETVRVVGAGASPGNISTRDLVRHIVAREAGTVPMIELAEKAVGTRSDRVPYTGRYLKMLSDTERAAPIIEEAKRKKLINEIADSIVQTVETTDKGAGSVSMAAQSTAAQETPQQTKSAPARRHIVAPKSDVSSKQVVKKAAQEIAQTAPGGFWKNVSRTLGKHKGKAAIAALLAAAAAYGLSQLMRREEEQPIGDDYVQERTRMTPEEYMRELTRAGMGVYAAPVFISPYEYRLAE